MIDTKNVAGVAIETDGTVVPRCKSSGKKYNENDEPEKSVDFHYFWCGW